MEKTQHILDSGLQAVLILLMPFVFIVLLLLIANFSYNSIVKNIERMKDDNYHGVAKSKSWYWCERFIDVTFSVIYIMLFSWLIILIWILTKTTSSGPALFKQERVGFRGKIFYRYGFRTMRFEETKKPNLSLDRDPRITSFGRFLRKTHFDFIPNIFNVLSGDMTIVGINYNRPFLMESRLKSGIVNNNKPGLITLSSIVKSIKDLDYEEIEKFDNYYANNKTLLLKVKIFFASIIVTYATISKY